MASLTMLAALTTTAHAFELTTRWTSTATNGTAGIANQGDPVTLTFSFVADGRTIDGAPSNLRSFLDSSFGAGPGGSDLTLRPWFPLFSSSFDRWSQLAGLTYNYEPNDVSGAFGSAAGSLGVRGDIRIGGVFIDGESGTNTLATNYYPTNGDMTLDTGNTSHFAPSSNNSRATRNTIMHEHGHGLGIKHVDSSNTNQLLEPLIITAFDGPQFDDILSAQRLYGDVYEKNGGNETAATATDLGALNFGVTKSIGTKANDAVVAATDTDFISIDDGSDIDFLSFTIDAPSLINLTLTPQGPIYNEGAQGGTQAAFNTAALSDLTLRLVDTDGTTFLSTSNFTGLGGAESITDFLLATPGEYFARIRGANNNIQMYRLDVVAHDAIDADFNQDLAVDGDDLAAWKTGFGASGSAVHGDGDADRDRDVDGADFLIWQRQLSGGPVVAVSNSVPEPASLTLIVLAAAGVATRRR